MMQERAPGTARYVREQIAELISRPVPWDWVVAVPEGFAHEFPCHEGCEIVELPGKKYSVFAMFRVARLWRQRQCMAGFSPAGIAALFSPLLCNYFDSNIFEYGKTWATSGEWARSHLLKWMAMDAFRRAKAVFVNSAYCAEYLKKRFPGFSKKFIVNHGILKTVISTPERPDWADERMDRQGIILCSSAFSDNKNQRRLIEAYGVLQASRRELPPLVLIGPCPTAYFKSVIRPVWESLPQPAQVIVPGYVSEGVLGWALINAKVLIQPSFAEGFSSLSVFQAMQSGIPVACSNTTSHPEGVGTAALLFNPASVEDIAGALVRLLDDEALRFRLREEGFQRVAELTWTANGDRVCVQITKLLEHTRKQDI
ncbi:MAG: glycosyltransferase family 1 protein [bacterium]